MILLLVLIATVLHPGLDPFSVPYILPYRHALVRLRKVRVPPLVQPERIWIHTGKYGQLKISTDPFPASKLIAQVSDLLRCQRIKRFFGQFHNVE